MSDRGVRVSDRAQHQRAQGRWILVRLLVVLCIAVALTVYAAPAAYASPARLDLGCDNDEPPIPASPHGPGSLIVQVTGPPRKDADPFTDKDVSLESVYGTTPQWWTLKNGCTGQFIASAGTAIGNILLELSGVVPNWTHALLTSVVAPDSWLRALTDPVVDATSAVTEAVWAPWLSVVLLLVAVVVLWRARAGAFAGSVHAGAWALGVLFVVSFLIQYPAEAVRGVDWGVRTVTTTFITAFDTDAPTPKQGQDPAVVAVSGQMDDIVRSTMYEAWLSGALGDAHSETATTYGPDLFKATHMSWAEAETYQQDPAGKGAAMVEAKQARFTQIAEEIERTDPVAYEHLRGEHWDKRITTALVNAVAVVVVCGYLLVAGLVILLSYALIRLVVPFAPAAGVLFMIDATRDMAVSSLKRVIGPLVMGPVYFLVALILLRMDTSIMATEIPWPLQIMIIGVLAWFAWTRTRPATYGLGLVGHAAGFAWSYALGRVRQPWREHQPAPFELERGSVAPTPAPTRGPNRHVVFMPGFTDRPMPPPVAAAPAVGEVLAASMSGNALGEGPPSGGVLDEGIQEVIDRSPHSERESWKRLYADFPRGRDHTYLEKAHWAAAAYKREGLAEHQHNRLRGQWTNYAFAHHYRAIEVSVHHLDEHGGPKALVRVDGFDNEGVASIKNVQLARVRDSTWKGYVNEARRKYMTERADIVVASTRGTQRKVEAGELDPREVGEALRGDVFLDVPPQKDPIPQEVIDYAEERGIYIREREPHPEAGDLDD